MVLMNRIFESTIFQTSEEASGRRINAYGGETRKGIMIEMIQISEIELPDTAKFLEAIQHWGSQNEWPLPLLSGLFSFGECWLRRANFEALGRSRVEFLEKRCPPRAMKK